MQVLIDLYDSRGAAVVDDNEVIQEYAGILRGEASAGRMPDPFLEIAQARFQRMKKGRRWQPTPQGTLDYEPDKIWSLGGGKSIQMRYAEAHHAVEHLEILNIDNGRNNAAHHLKTARLLKWIPDLYAGMCTLEELQRRANPDGESESD